MSIMMFDQFSAIFENTPGIDAMQNKKGERVRTATVRRDFALADSLLVGLAARPL